MDSWLGLGFSNSSNSGVVGPVQLASPLAEGGTVVFSNGQLNASILLNPSGPRNQVNIQLPNPPRDGQVITIGSTQTIQLVQFIPDVPSSPDFWDVADVFQIKWFDALGIWALLK